MLERLNPLAKLAAAVIYFIAATVIFDPLIQLTLLLSIILALIILERVEPLMLLKVMAPFALVGLGYLWTNLLFHDSAGYYMPSPAGTAEIADPAVNAGVTLFLRAVVFGAISYCFIRTTDPAELMRSLMQQAKLPPHIGFSIFSAVQFLPYLRDELRQIRLARAMRTGRRRMAGFIDLPGIAIPLLASTIRKASRAAISMEARGLTRPMHRTSLHRARFARRDAIFMTLALGLLAAFLAGVALIGNLSP
ncbi:MAG TPA: energy-coupling factor transporter transmembrane component T [Dongiaceae bacterium]|nr:energy-coupling factor transporter transmembrane component T [Dongiaceae bacterium]